MFMMKYHSLSLLTASVTRDAFKDRWKDLIRLKPLVTGQPAAEHTVINSVTSDVGGNKLLKPEDTSDRCGHRRL